MTFLSCSFNHLSQNVHTKFIFVFVTFSCPSFADVLVLHFSKRIRLHFFSCHWLLFLFVDEIFVFESYCPVNFVFWNFVHFLYKTVRRNHQSCFVIGLVPKCKKSYLKSCVFCSKLPNIILKFL